MIKEFYCVVLRAHLQSYTSFKAKVTTDYTSEA